MFAKFSGVESERSAFKFTEKKKNIFVWNYEVSCLTPATTAKKCTNKCDARAVLWHYKSTLQMADIFLDIPCK